MRSWGVRAGALVVIAAAISTGALVNPGTASAFTGPPPITQAPNWTTTYTALGGPVEAGQTLTPEVRTALLKGRIAAGGFPLLRSVGTVGLLAGAFDLGWNIGGAIDDHWLHMEARIGGGIGTTAAQDASGSTFRVGGGSWVWTAPGGGIADSGQVSDFDHGVWFFHWLECVGTGCTPSGPSGALSQCCGFTGAPAAVVAASGGLATGHLIGGDSLTYYAEDDVFQAELAPTDFDLYTGQTAGSNFTSPGGSTWDFPTQPSWGDPVQEDVVDALMSGDADTDLAVNQVFFPDYEGAAEEFEMPDCENITYSACLDLLQDAGYVGTITETTVGYDLADFDIDPGKIISTDPASGTTGVAVGDDVEFFFNPNPMPLEIQAQLANESATDWYTRIGMDTEHYDIVLVELPPETADPESGPDAPIRIRIPKPGGGTVMVPVPHPGEGSSTWRIPYPDPEDDPIPVEIFTNPPGVPEVESPGPGLPGGGAGCDPWLEAEFDLSPITDADLGEKFPFGIPEWLLDQINALESAPDAPVLSVHIASLDMDYGPMDFDVFSPYMSTMRTVLSWLLWFGTVWFVGTSLLGFRGTGNPADAVDDYLGEMF